MATGVEVKSAAPRVGRLLHGFPRRLLGEGQEDWSPAAFPERLHDLDIIATAILLLVGTVHDQGKMILA